MALTGSLAPARLARPASALLPWVLLLIAVAAIEHAGGARWSEIGLYMGALALFVTLPGVLAWRLLWTGAPGSWIDQILFGTTTGLCLQLPLYIVGVSIGAPLLVAALPAILIGIVAVHPRRQALLRPELEPSSRAVAWTVAVVTTYASSWIGGTGWLLWPHPRVAPASPNGDQPYQVAVIGELRHHFPPELSWSAGEPLHYHWFANAHMAASSWLTGLEPSLILDRLWLLPTVALVLTGIAVIGQRLTGSVLVGVLGPCLYALVGDFSPSTVAAGISRFDEQVLTFWDALSPSLTFASAQLLLATWVVVHVLALARPQVRDWVLLGIVILMLGGSKATCLPILLSGILGAIVVRAVRERRVPGHWFAVFGVGIAAAVIAAPTVSTQGSRNSPIDPFHIGQLVHYRLGLTDPGPWVSALAIGLLLLSWGCAWLGATVLLGKSDRGHPAAAFLVAAGVASVLAALATGQSAFGESYFPKQGAPLLAIAAAWGLWRVLEPLPVRRRTIVVSTGIAVGLLASYAARAQPWIDEADLAGDVPELLRLYAVVLGVLIALLVLVPLLLTVLTRHRLPVLAFVLVAVAALGLIRVPDTLERLTREPWKNRTPVAAATAHIGPGGLAAARWLRAHSSTDDVLATNAHMMFPGSDDNRAFWIGAYAERRVLIEGWGYTRAVGQKAESEDISTFYVGPPDEELLAVNDAAFNEPTAEAVATLARDHEVRWLVVDTRLEADLANLRKYASLRFRSGAYAVLEIDEEN